MAKDNKNKKLLAIEKRLGKSEPAPEVKNDIINSSAAKEFIESSHLSTNSKVNDQKTTVLSFYINDNLLNKLNLFATNKKIVRSKIIRAAEELYYNSDFSISNVVEELDSRNNKLTCAFVKSELINRMKNKGFRKISDYLNEALLKEIDKIK